MTYNGSGIRLRGIHRYDGYKARPTWTKEPVSGYNDYKANKNTVLKANLADLRKRYGVD